MLPTTSNTIWVEKYRPDSLDNYIGNPEVKRKFASYIKDQDLPHILLVGTPGTGKTTAAKILIKHIDCHVLALNASDDNNIETVRTKIRSFASTLGWDNKKKIVFLDEANGLTWQGQEALKNIMETYSEVTRFIMTTNHVEKIAPAIISRTQVFHIEPPTVPEVAKHVLGILKSEGVTCAMADLKKIIDAHFPDVRHIIGVCQNHTINGVLSITDRELIGSDSKIKIASILTSKATFKTKFDEIRQLIANHKMRDFTEMYRYLFDHVDTLFPDHIPESILILGKGQVNDALVVDKEINFMAVATELIKVNS